MLKNSRILKNENIDHSIIAVNDEGNFVCISENSMTHYTHKIRNEKANYMAGNLISSSIICDDNSATFQLRKPEKPITLIMATRITDIHIKHNNEIVFNLSDTTYDIFNTEITGKEYENVFTYRENIPGLSVKDAFVTYLMGLSIQEAQDFIALPQSVKYEIVVTHPATQYIDIEAYLNMYEDKELTHIQRTISKIVLEHEYM